MSQPGRGGREDAWPAAVLALLALPLICYRLGDYSLVNGDEAIKRRRR